MKGTLSLLVTAMALFFQCCKKGPDEQRPLSPVPPVVATNPVTGILSDKAISGFTISNIDTFTLIERGIVWSTDSLPTVALANKLFTAGNMLSMDFEMTGLSTSTRYFVRAYIITASQDIIYGNLLTFISGRVLPIITTKPASGLGHNTTTSGFTISNPGNYLITERGIVWSTDSLPSANISNKLFTSQDTSNMEFEMRGLIPVTRYFVRAYVIAPEADTLYGNEIVFTTNADPAISVTTIAVTSIETDRAFSGFQLFNATNLPVAESGIVWSTQTNPSASLHTKSEYTITQSGSYPRALINLNCFTAYYVRGYAITGTDTIYGNSLQFTTLVNGPNVEQFNLSRTNFTDQVIDSFHHINGGWPRNGVNISSEELTLPPGIFLYVKFESVVPNIFCENGTYVRNVATGDTVHFGNIPHMNATTFFKGIKVIPGAPPTSVSPMSEVSFSVHLAGIANTGDASYNCEFIKEKVPGTSTYHIWYRDNTSACSNRCTFQ